MSSSVVDPDPHRGGENGSETDPGSIKSSQNKGDKKIVFKYFIRFLIYNNLVKKTEI